jgi:hypothetical protein
MKRLIASSLATVAVLALAGSAPALGEATRKTELVELDGRSVDRIPLRYDIDAAWVVDNQNILYRDTSRGHYLVTLKEACKRIVVRQPFTFRPGYVWELRANRTYEVRPWAGQPCDVAKIAQVDDARADALREAALRRAW